jgi:hypothetical protein
MKHVHLSFVCAFIMSWTTSLAQDSTSGQPIPALPQGQYGSPVNDSEAARKEDRVDVDATSLPPAMKDVLARDEKFDGWEKQPIYFDKSTDQYIVHVVKENGTQTFRFNKNGDPIVVPDLIERSGSRSKK